MTNNNAMLTVVVAVIIEDKKYKYIDNICRCQADHIETQQPFFVFIRVVAKAWIFLKPKKTNLCVNKKNSCMVSMWSAFDMNIYMLHIIIGVQCIDVYLRNYTLSSYALYYICSQMVERIPKYI